MAEKKKLFGNVGGNQFRLITEGMEYNSDKPHGHEQVREGLKKVFSNGGKEISYQRLQYVGLGYIKDVTQAARCALREAKQLAEEFGYQDDENSQKFVKAYESHDESDMNNPEETREVQIGNEILKLTQPLVNRISDEDWQKFVTPIQVLAKELIQMHGGK